MSSPCSDMLPSQSLQPVLALTAPPSEGTGAPSQLDLMGPWASRQQGHRHAQRPLPWLMGCPAGEWPWSHSEPPVEMETPAGSVPSCPHASCFGPPPHGPWGAVTWAHGGSSAPIPAAPLGREPVPCPSQGCSAICHFGKCHEEPAWPCLCSELQWDECVGAGVPAATGSAEGAGSMGVGSGTHTSPFAFSPGLITDYRVSGRLRG